MHTFRLTTTISSKSFLLLSCFYLAGITPVQAGRPVSGLAQQGTKNNFVKYRRLSSTSQPLFVTNKTQSQRIQPKNSTSTSFQQKRPFSAKANNFPRVTQQLERITTEDQSGSKPRKNVVVFGSGMAGLTAALELQNLGHNVSVIEATSRPGGRVWTKRFQSGEYHELGAMRIPKSHDFTRYYIEQAGLTGKLRRFVTSHQNLNCFYHFGGKVSRIKDAVANGMFDQFGLTPHERLVASQAVAPAIFGIQLENAIKHLNAHYPGIGEEEFWGGIFGDRFLDDRATEYEGLSLGEFIGQRVSPAAKELIASSTGLDCLWDRSLTMFLRDEIVQTGAGLEEITGGLDLLPSALANKLGKDKIRFNTEVASIKLQDDGRVHYTTRPTDPTKWDSPPTDQDAKEEVADYVVCTIPFPVLRRTELGGLSLDKMSAIRNLDYASSAKVLLHVTDRFWENPPYNIFGGASMSDDITRSTYYPSDHALIPLQKPNKPSGTVKEKGLFNTYDLTPPEMETPKSAQVKNPGVLVGSYCWGQDARRLGSLTPPERAETVTRIIEKFHPEIRQHLDPTEPHASMFWDSFRWARGAFCFMKPRDLPSYYHATIKSEGNLHFAGEHCSLDQAWIQGAVMSGLRVVEEIVKKD